MVLKFHVRLAPRPDIVAARPNVRFGSKADICSAKGHVRFTPRGGGGEEGSRLREFTSELEGPETSRWRCHANDDCHRPCHHVLDISLCPGFLAGSGTPGAAFPNPDRPVADIVSPIWHGEKERDAAGANDSSSWVCSASNPG